MHTKTLTFAFAISLAMSGCQSSDDSTDSMTQTGPWSTGVTLPETVTEQGDAERGRHLLLHGNYMSCGIPYKLWANELSAGIVRGALAVADDAIPLPGREGRNADLPYVNAFTTTEGVDVVNANCLHCHASRFNGELVIGLETRASISRAVRVIPPVSRLAMRF